MHELRGARALDLDDLKVADAVRPPAPDVTLGLAGSRRARALGRAPSLRLSSDRLVVRHPVLLREPLVVDRDDVAVAAVDTRRREGGDTVRFPFSHEFEWTQPFPGDEAEIYGWLYVRGGRSPLPYLCDVQGLPNLVVVFREPLASLACRAPRRAGRPLPRPPVPGRPLLGFFARVCDAEAARLALRDWGVMRALTVRDAEHAGVATDTPAVR
jgi:hypothetical protein